MNCMHKIIIDEERLTHTLQGIPGNEPKGGHAALVLNLLPILKHNAKLFLSIHACPLRLTLKAKVFLSCIFRQCPPRISRSVQKRQFTNYFSIQHPERIAAFIRERRILMCQKQNPILLYVQFLNITLQQIRNQQKAIHKVPGFEASTSHLWLAVQKLYEWHNR